MLKKQISIGHVGGTEISIHISLILSTILAWAVLALITKPALGFGYGLRVYGPIAFMAAVITLAAKASYEISRLHLLKNQGMVIKKLVLLPLSGLLIYEKEQSRKSLGFWSSLLPAIPLILFASIFSALSMSPTASAFQIPILRGIALVLLFFIGARILGAFAVDRLNSVHSIVWLITDNLEMADFVYAIWRNVSILSILLAAVSFFPEYRWLELALAVSIAWGLYDGVLLQKRNELRLQIERFKSNNLANQHLSAG